MVAWLDLLPSIPLRAAFLSHLPAGLPPACIGLVSAENSSRGFAPPVAGGPQAEHVFLDKPATLLAPLHFYAPLLDGCYVLTKVLVRALAKHI